MKTENIWVLVPAAGTGSRMQAATPKQYLPLCGEPVLAHTLNLLAHTPQLAGVVVALDKSDNRFQQLISIEHTPLATVVGGQERAHSVLAGLDYIATRAQKNDWVLVHDAARPCLRVELLQAFCQQIFQTVAGGILAVPVADTLKRVAGDLIEHTVDRSALWAAQTPQMFRLTALRTALAEALAQGVEITDEASAMEWAGHEVKVVQGDPTNLKITRPQDLSLAELIKRSHEKTV